jgi:bifunctional polynucleotide phosphatase/kinase
MIKNNYDSEDGTDSDSNTNSENTGDLNRPNGFFMNRWYIKYKKNSTPNNIFNIDPIRVAAFDLDDTIIIKEKKYLDTGFKLLDEYTIDIIKKYMINNYAIAIFSNQSTFNNKSIEYQNIWTNNLINLVNKLCYGLDNHCVHCYVSLSDNFYRKPNIGMWNLFFDCLVKLKKKQDPSANDNSIRISRSSFFCGDAAGRIWPSKIVQKLHKYCKKDFADSDRKFALNIGLNFFTPDEFYSISPNNNGATWNQVRKLIAKPFDGIPYELSGFNPEKYLRNIDNGNIEDNEQFIPRHNELIILIALPASGKTTFYNNYVKQYNYTYINFDTERYTNTSITKLLTHCVNNNKSAIIDNTNCDKSVRKKYIDIWRSVSVNVRAIYFDVDKDLSMHLNNVRHTYDMLYLKGIKPVPLLNKKINAIAYHKIFKKFEKPSYTEGYNLIQTKQFKIDATYLADEKWLSVFKLRF